jgi:hypothetical protein
MSETRTAWLRWVIECLLLLWISFGAKSVIAADPYLYGTLWNFQYDGKTQYMLRLGEVQDGLITQDARILTWHHSNSDKLGVVLPVFLDAFKNKDKLDKYRAVRDLLTKYMVQGEGFLSVEKRDDGKVNLHEYCKVIQSNLERIQSDTGQFDNWDVYIQVLDFKEERVNKYALEWFAGIASALVSRKDFVDPASVDLIEINDDAYKDLTLESADAGLHKAFKDAFSKALSDWKGATKPRVAKAEPAQTPALAGRIGSSASAGSGDKAEVKSTSAVTWVAFGNAIVTLLVVVLLFLMYFKLTGELKQSMQDFKEDVDGQFRNLKSTINSPTPIRGPHQSTGKPVDIRRSIGMDEPGEARSSTSSAGASFSPLEDAAAEERTKLRDDFRNLTKKVDSIEENLNTQPFGTEIDKLKTGLAALQDQLERHGAAKKVVTQQSDDSIRLHAEVGKLVERFEQQQLANQALTDDLATLLRRSGGDEAAS